MTICFNKINVIITVLSLGLFSFLQPGCRRQSVEDTSVSDAQRIRLKEISVQGMAASYVKCTYDERGFVTNMGYESGNFQYKIEYKDGRICRMINNAFAENDTLLYFYTGKNVSRIDWIVPGNGKRQELALYYDTNNRLVQLNFRKTSFNNIFKKMLFFYNSDNNMIRCEIYYDSGNGLLLTNTYLFEEFDNKKNVFPNELLKEYHLYFLPQVKLQQNNSLSSRLLGIHNDFVSRNNFQYDNNLPIKKTTILKQTRGAGAGMIRTGTSLYHYY